MQTKTEQFVGPDTTSSGRVLQERVRSRLRQHQRRRILYTTLLASGCVVLVFVGLFSLEDSLLYFRVPSDILSDSSVGEERMRLGGMVLEDSVGLQDDGGWRFLVGDGKATMEVSFSGALPDLFQEGQGMIAEGYYREGIFRADFILAKHDENYTPRSLAGENLLEAGNGGKKHEDASTGVKAGDGF